MKHVKVILFRLFLPFFIIPVVSSIAFATVIQLEKSYYVIPNPGMIENIDNDKDGYSENQGDCNDAASFIYPGAVETCGDGVDQDCNGNDMDCPLRPVENRLLELINQERSGAGLPTLVRDKGLDRIAHWHVYNMAKYHFLSHTDRNGRSAEQRARYYSGDSTVRCVELIQWWGGEPSGDVHYTGFYNSPAHHSGYMEEGIFNLGPTSHVGVSVVEGTGPASSQYAGSNGSYAGVFLCDNPLTLSIDPFSE